MATDMSSFETESIKNGCKITKVIGRPTGRLEIPMTIDGECVCEIADYAFAWCKCLEVVIPEGVTKIGKAAFLYSDVEKVTLPSTLKEIGIRAFFRSSLQEVTISKGVENIGMGAFSRSAITRFTVDEENAVYCSVDGVLCSKDNTILHVVPYGITKLEISEGVETIAECASVGNSKLASVVFPTTLNEIQDCAFAHCKALETVTFPVDMEMSYIGRGAFLQCHALTACHIPNGVWCISGFAFAGCGKLRQLTLPSSLTTIESRAFTACKSLTSLEISEGIEEIGEMAFLGCTSLASLKMPELEILGENVDGSEIKRELVFLGCPAVPEAEEMFTEYTIELFCPRCGISREWTVESVEDMLTAYDYTADPIFDGERDYEECSYCYACPALDAIECDYGDFDDIAFFDVTLGCDPHNAEIESELEREAFNDDDGDDDDDNDDEDNDNDGLITASEFFGL